LPSGDCPRCWNCCCCWHRCLKDDWCFSYTAILVILSACCLPTNASDLLRRTAA
jgi:hypothetical protein